MPTLVTKTVKTGGDYTSWSSAEAALPSDIRAGSGTDENWEFQGNGTFTSGSNLLTVAGTLTDSTHYVHFTTESGASWRDNANVQTNAYRFNSANGCSLSLTGDYDSAIICNQGYTRFSNLQVEATAAHSAAISNQPDTAGLNDWNNCILESAIQVGTVYGNVKFRNTLMVSRGSSLARILICSGTGPTFYNVTMVVPSDKTSASAALTGIYVSSQSFTNCAFFGVSDVGSTTGRGFTTCYTDDPSPPSGCTTAAYSTAQFANITDATRDFKPVTGSALVDTGTTDSTNAPIDAAGTPRPQGSAYDVGAWELFQNVIATAFQTAFQSNAFQIFGGVLAGGTTYNQALNATVSAGAAIVRAAKVIKSASKTLVASVARSIGKKLSATKAAAGSIIKRVAKPLAAAKTVSAAIVRSAKKSLAGSKTTSASVTRRTGKTLSGTSVTAATLRRAVSFTRAAAQSVVAVVVKRVGKILSTAKSTTATLTAIKVRLLVLSASKTVSAAIVRRVNAVRSASKTLVATVTTIKVKLFTLSASKSVTATVRRSIGFTRAAAKSTVATIAASRFYTRVLSAVVTTSATVRRLVSSAKTATKSSSASIVKSIGKKLAASRTLVATITALKFRLFVLTASKSVSAALVRQAKVVKAAVSVAVATRRVLVGKVLAAAKSTAASISGIKVKLLTLTATIGKSATIRRSVAAVRLATKTTSATVRRAVSATRVASKTALGIVVKQVRRTRASVSVTVGAITSMRVKLLTLTATVGKSATISFRKTLSKVIAATQTSSAAVRRMTGKVVLGAAQTATAIGKALSVTKPAQTVVVGVVRKLVSKTFSALRHIIAYISSGMATFQPHSRGARTNIFTTRERSDLNTTNSRSDAFDHQERSDVYTKPGRKDL